MVGQKDNLQLLKLVEKLVGADEDHESFIFIKDTDHKYLACNNNYACFLGLKDESAIAGLNDYVINPNHAHLYKEDDDRVLQGQVLRINNPAYFKNYGLVTVTGKMIPMLDELQRVTGIFGCTKLMHTIASMSFVHVLALLNGTTIPLIVRKNFYSVRTDYGVVRISKREVQCILFLFKCLTSDHIAHNLQLSRRSVESYFVNIKNKLNVHHKSEILEAVIKGGLLEQL